MTGENDLGLVKTDALLAELASRGVSLDASSTLYRVCCIRDAESGASSLDIFHVLATSASEAAQIAIDTVGEPKGRCVWCVEREEDRMVWGTPTTITAREAEDYASTAEHTNVGGRKG